MWCTTVWLGLSHEHSFLNIIQNSSSWGGRQETAPQIQVEYFINNFLKEGCDDVIKVTMIASKYQRIDC